MILEQYTFATLKTLLLSLTLIQQTGLKLHPFDEQQNV